MNVFCLFRGEMLTDYVETLLAIYKYKSEAELKKRELDEENINVMELDDDGSPLMGEEYYVIEVKVEE